jgi:hypothetical protein
VGSSKASRVCVSAIVRFVFFGDNVLVSGVGRMLWVRDGHKSASSLLETSLVACLICRRLLSHPAVKSNYNLVVAFRHLPTLRVSKPLRPTCRRRISERCCERSLNQALYTCTDRHMSCVSGADRPPTLLYATSVVLQSPLAHPYHSPHGRFGPKMRYSSHHFLRLCQCSQTAEEYEKTASRMLEVASSRNVERALMALEQASTTFLPSTRLFLPPCLIHPPVIDVSLVPCRGTAAPCPLVVDGSCVHRHSTTHTYIASPSIARHSSLFPRRRPVCSVTAPICRAAAGQLPRVLDCY